MKIVQIGTCVANDDLTQIVKEKQPEILVLIEPMSIHNEKINECY
jgi:3-deoxy-D-arabino-heptulosonate 7-phosphate (DAHP) synthase